MALSAARLDAHPHRTAGPAWHHPHIPTFGPVLGYGYDFYIGRFELHHNVGADRRQSVRRQITRSTTRYSVPSVDGSCHAPAAILRHGSLRHGRHRNSKYIR